MSHRAALVLVMVMAAAGCRAQTPPTAGQSTPANQPRIVSLSPAISRSLVDLSIGDLVVGRTPFCHSINDSVPVVGDLYNLNYEQLVRLKPTHVLAQPPTGSIDQHLRELADQRGWTLAQWKLNGIADIETLVRELPEAVFQGDKPRLAAASARAAQILNDLAEQLSPGPAAARVFQGRTLLIASVDPILAFADETYLDDVLAALQANNAAPGTGWVELSYEDVVRINPDAIILVRETIHDGDGESSSLTSLRNLDVEAARSGRITELVHPDALLPSSSVREVAAALRGILSSFESSQQ